MSGGLETQGKKGEELLTDHHLVIWSSEGELGIQHALRWVSAKCKVAELLAPPSLTLWFSAQKKWIAHSRLGVGVACCPKCGSFKYLRILTGKWSKGRTGGLVWHPLQCRCCTGLLWQRWSSDLPVYRLSLLQIWPSALSSERRKEIADTISSVRKTEFGHLKGVERQEETSRGAFASETSLRRCIAAGIIYPIWTGRQSVAGEKDIGNTLLSLLPLTWDWALNRFVYKVLQSAVYSQGHLNVYC